MWWPDEWSDPMQHSDDVDDIQQTLWEPEEEMVNEGAYAEDDKDD